MFERIHEFIWGAGMLGVFLAVGVCYTIRLRGFPILGIRIWMKNTIGSLGGVSQKDSSTHGVTQFQSACTALAATIGTGNIAGVATAILAGGAGAVFWMWVSAFLGMATAYGETELGIRFRRRSQNGGWISGAMMYLEYGLGCRWLAVLYAAFCLFASFGMGNMVQANAIAESTDTAFGIPPLMIGIVLAASVGYIISNGTDYIARISEKLVPISAIFYMTAAFGIIFIFRKNFFHALFMILQDAFSFQSAAGGAAGFFVSKSVRYGIARGVFSNEAGLGSMAALNGGADAEKEGSQGQWAIFEVFFDTIVSCTLTAMVILCAAGDEIAEFRGNGAELVDMCFSRGFGNIASGIVAFCAAMFAFATIIAWYYMGKQAVTYLCETIGVDFSSIYMGIYIGCVFFGSLISMETVWKISDIFNGMMALPNLTALILLIKEVKKPEVQNDTNQKERLRKRSF